MPRHFRLAGSSPPVTAIASRRSRHESRGPTRERERERFGLAPRRDFPSTPSHPKVGPNKRRGDISLPLAARTTIDHRIESAKSWPALLSRSCATDNGEYSRVSLLSIA